MKPFFVLACFANRCPTLARILAPGLTLMKTALIISIAFAFGASATTSALAKDPPRRGRVGDISNPEAEKPPFVGMTKAQAFARYGEPKKHTVTDEGEQWTYILNSGEVIGKAFIPFNFKHTPIRTGVLIFSPEGKVKKFTWDAETNG